MPLNVRRICTSIIISTFAAAGAASAQTSQASPGPVAQPAVQSPVVKAPTSGDVMRDRISKAKAYIAVRNYNAAIYELENIRRETSDSSVNAVANVLLMNSYLEQGDYKRASDFLTDLYNQQKTTKPNAGEYYAAASAQVVKSARNQIERYRGLGLSVSDRNLPLEAVNDIERMRETLELVVTQAKEMSADKTKSAAAMGMLEEATTTRSAIARDDYDARRWRDQVADSREDLVNSRSVITNAVDGTTTQVAAVIPTASTSTPAGQPLTYTPEQPTFRPVSTEPAQKPADVQVAAAKQPNVATPNTATPNVPAQNSTSGNTPRIRVVSDAPKTGPAAVKAETAVVSPAGTADASPLEIGSLIGYATKQAAPVYPAAAKSIRAAGVVKVEVTVSETGDVTTVEKASGPALLQAAAKDAIRKWKFKPFMRDGQAVKATGFVNFNFNL
ncbi:MAG: TonB family protein [Acidobacteriota bacterium]